jgi:broad specificity phosphatase PhoE
MNRRSKNRTSIFFVCPKAMSKFIATIKNYRQAILFACLYLTLSAAQAAAIDDSLWQRLEQGGTIMLIRHTATEPGMGDPPQFKLGDCATQRNLSAAGREQARSIGRELQRRKIPVAEVLSSEWCRCIDTARLAFAKARTWPPLNSTFNHPERAAAQAATIREHISAYQGKANQVLVTHQVIIGALTNQWVGQGEIVIVAPQKSAAGFEYIGKLMLDQPSTGATSR